MDIRELEDFRLSDAVKFHDALNPDLWENNKLKPEVKDQLLKIANDFILELGVAIPKIKDITISGSNAAYSYTPYSDLDLHILVDFNQLPNNEVYQELFTSKKTLYNDNHKISVNGVPVELYVQDSNQPVVSLGEYSIVNDDWIKIPKKQKANFDQNATSAKYKKLGNLIELALQSENINKIDKVLKIIKRYRKAGLDQTGEFGPENLAFKALRNMGLIKKLYDYKNNLHSKELSIEDYHPNDKLPRNVNENIDYMAGHCHVMALALKQLHPDWKIRAHIGWEEESEDDEDYRIDHVYIVAPDGSAYDCRGKFSNEQELVGPDETGGVETQFVNYSLANLKADVKRGELKRFTKDDILKALEFVKRININVNEIKVGSKEVKEVLDTEPRKTNKAKWDFSDPDMQELNFTASNGQQYRLDFLAPYIGPDEINQYNLLPDASDKYLDRGFFVQFEQVNKRSPWKQGKQGIEGTGAAAEIFGIVSNAILQFVKKKKPTYLYFQAAESNRISLYSAIVKRLLPNLPGWKSQGPSSDGVFTLYSPFKKVTKEASGYIPSEKEKNDPRFKTALTVDVKPDSIQKNAKAFGFKVARNGKPPLLRK